MGGGYPIQSWRGSTPSSQGGVPDQGTPNPDLGWGTPTQTWDGVPPTQIWDRVPPPRPGMGYPPTQTCDWVPLHPDLGWDTSPPRPFYPPPPMVNRQTFPSINITFSHTTYAGDKKKSKRKIAGLEPRISRQRLYYLAAESPATEWILILNPIHASVISQIL